MKKHYLQNIYCNKITGKVGLFKNMEKQQQSLIT